MIFDWLKRYMPRSLFGRTALILILPVATLQVLVSVVFVQRHFEGVTRQMTGNVLVEMRYLVERIDREPDIESARRAAADLGQALEMAALLAVPVETRDRRHFFDLSGRVVIATLHDGLPEVSAVDLTTDRRAVDVSLVTRHGGLRLVLSRERVSASNPHQLLVLMLVAGGLTTLISFLFLRNQVRPIRRLARAAEAFGKGRHVVYRPAGALEVRAAGTAFLDMRARIERQIEQRTLMLSGVSHDLRTPLTRLKLALSLQPENEETEEMLRDVRDMQRLVDEFLAFARGDALDDPVEVDLTALLCDVAEDALRAGQWVELGDVDQSGVVQARPLALTRALENLIGNAVRYGSRARLSLHRLERSVRIRVEDDGPGIPPDRRAEAIKAFARLDPARGQNDATGVGLGLAIAADIARKHGGTLHLGESAVLGGLCADLVLAR